MQNVYKIEDSSIVHINNHHDCVIVRILCWVLQLIEALLRHRFHPKRELQEKSL